jgi:lipoprotein-anchoring transpeptidase ErfK/SrfK
MRLHSMGSRLFAGLLAIGGLLALGTAAQAQSDQERFFGSGPRYGTTYRPYPSPYQQNPYPVPYQQSPYSGTYQNPYSNPYPSASPIPKTTVSFDASYAPGTIIINTTERRLYYVLGGGQALRYGIGVGRVGFTWAGVTQVSQKREWPDWTPPADMLRRRPDLPRHMKGGIDNPLGARAMYLGSSLYRIHGSNEPETIGQAVSSGCFRMTNEDVVDLYSRVRIGSKVIVLR